MDLNELRDRIVADPDVPEMVRSFLRRGADLVEIRLDRHGNWWHGGDTFQNEKLIRLFHRSLHQTRAGNWVLRIKPYTYPVVVDLTGTFVERLREQADGKVAAKLRTGDAAEFRLEDVYTDGEDLIATRINGVPARIVDTAYRQLTTDIELDGDVWVLHYDGQAIRTRPLPSDFFATDGE